MKGKKGERRGGGKGSEGRMEYGERRGVCRNLTRVC